MVDLGVNNRPATLQRLEDFIWRNSVDGRYSEDMALKTLLSCIFPDSRAFALHHFEPGVEYRKGAHGKEIKKNAVQMVVWKGRVAGASDRIAAFLEHSVNGMLPSLDLIQKGDDSWRTMLVRNGIIAVREGRGGKVGYSLTAAGELAKRVAESAIHFVAEARKSLPEHNFDSMERLLGHPGRVLKVYNTVKWLVENGSSTEAELVRMFCGESAPQQNEKGNFTSTLQDMRHAGLIDVFSFTQKTYRIANGGIQFFGEEKDVFYKRARERIPDQWFPQNIFEQVTDYLADSPDASFSTNTIAGHIGAKLGGDESKSARNLKAHVRLSLRALEELGMLTLANWPDRPDAAALLRAERKSKKEQSVILANDMTKLFYTIVLKNAEFAAELAPERMEHYQISREAEKAFIKNMDEEKSQKGAERSESDIEKAERFIRTKTKYSSEHSARISDIQQSLCRYGVNLSRDSLIGILDVLRERGKIEHIGRGCYAVPQRLLRNARSQPSP